MLPRSVGLAMSILAALEPLSTSIDLTPTGKSALLWIRTVDRGLISTSLFLRYPQASQNIAIPAQNVWGRGNLFGLLNLDYLILVSC